MKLTAHEVAELTGMTLSHVCRLLREGVMAGSKHRGLLWEVELSEALRFCKSRGGRPRSATKLGGSHGQESCRT